MTAEEHAQLWIPPGCAHGFYVLTESADFVYKCTDYYHPDSELSLAWDDPDRRGQVADPGEGSASCSCQQKTAPDFFGKDCPLYQGIDLAGRFDSLQLRSLNERQRSLPLGPDELNILPGLTNRRRSLKERSPPGLMGEVPVDRFCQTRLKGLVGNKPQIPLDL